MMQRVSAMRLVSTPSSSLTVLRQNSLVSTPMRGFRKNAQLGYYNQRFKPSTGKDGAYVATAAPFHGPTGSESVSALCCEC